MASETDEQVRVTMRSGIVVLSLVVALAGPWGASAVTITVPLDGLVGDYSGSSVVCELRQVCGEPGQDVYRRSDTFDFGVRFAEIEDVFITISVGDGDPGFGFGAWLSSLEVGPTDRSRVSSELSGLPGSTISMSFEYHPAFTGMPREPWPSFLFEGAGIVTMRQQLYVSPPHVRAAEILAAELSITGTPVPESSALLLAAGALAAVAWRARR